MAELLAESTQAAARVNAGGARVGRRCATPLPLGEGADAHARRAALAYERSHPSTNFHGHAIGPDAKAVDVVSGLRYEGPGGSPVAWCGYAVARRSLVVTIFRRAYARPPLNSESLSQGADFVARFPGGYRVWQAAH
jgi:hypothetical protein